MTEYKALINTRGTYANVRSEPDIESDIIGGVANWGTVIRLEHHDTPDWAAIQLFARVGFVSYSVARFMPLKDMYPPAPIYSIDGIPCADGFDSPVGYERRGVDVWPRFWMDASPYARLYLAGTPRQAYHTGADLNWGWRPGDDAGQPVYAPAQGVVTYVGVGSAALGFGSLVVIRHDPLYDPGGPVVYTRYGHMRNITATVNQRVPRGGQIGEVAGVGGFPAHLHYDTSVTNVLQSRPGDWPGMNKQRVLNHYADPRQFTQNNRPGGHCDE